MDRFSKTWTTCYSEGRLHEIEVQVLIRRGLPRFDIVGLPQNMIREGKDRIMASLHCLGLELPTERVLVHLNPGDIPKEGSHFDLPILAGILEALGLRPPNQEKIFYWGELQLDASLRPTSELLGHLLYAQELGGKSFVAARIPSFILDLSPHLKGSLYSFAKADDLLDPVSVESPGTPEESSARLEKLWFQNSSEDSQWNSLKGSEDQFLFWILASLGRLNILLEGSPGVGKTSWCFAINELQRPLPQRHWRERFIYRQAHSTQCASLLSLARRPFESPHHTSSVAAVVGGGSGKLCAGAITRAHRGILFLDEIAEFHRDVLQALREPLEEATLTVARRGLVERFPADIQLLAAMNPCRCGNHSSARGKCSCSSTQFWAYRSKLSEPIRDRFHHRVWWKFENFTRKAEFELKNVKARLLQAERICPQLKLCDFAPLRNPRTQRLWLDSLIAWAQWHDISEISDHTAQAAYEFFAQMEIQDESERYEITARRT